MKKNKILLMLAEFVNTAVPMRVIAMAVLLLGSSAAQAVLTANVLTYGATPNIATDNDASAFSTALKAVVTAGGGSLIVPAGEYHFKTRVTVDLNGKTVTIQGDGVGVSEIHCTNTTGLFWFNNAATSESQLDVYDISLTADLPGSGTALKINNSAVSSSDICSLLLEHVGIKPLSGSTNYFVRGVDGSNLKKPVFNDVFVRLQYPSVGDRDSGWPASYGQFGVYINGAESPLFSNCYSKRADWNIYLTGITGQVVVDNCITTGGDTGIYIKAKTPQSCTALISAGQVAQLNKGVMFVDTGSVHVRDLTVLCDNWCTNALPTDLRPLYSDIYAYNSFPVLVEGTDFHVGDHVSTGRTCVNLIDTNNALLVAGQGATIRRCVFNANITSMDVTHLNAQHSGIFPPQAIPVQRQDMNNVKTTLIQPDWVGVYTNTCVTSTLGVTLSQSIYNELGVD
ncbi:MAG: hypothetical protein WC701_10760 [Kiritimatiellales bacterium]|jgi:hypothetical protein